MEEIINLFKEYTPIMSIYENDSEYICFPKVWNGEEPLAVYYDKNLKQYQRVFFYEENNIPEDVESSNLIYGKELEFEE